nr:unnamed protein product [Naegleria fowleri]
MSSAFSNPLSNSSNDSVLSGVDGQIPSETSTTTPSTVLSNSSEDDIHKPHCVVPPSISRGGGAVIKAVVGGIHVHESSSSQQPMKRLICVLTSISTFVMIILILAGLLVLPLLYFVNFLKHPERSETVIMTPYIPDSPSYPPNFTAPYLHANINITTPLNARFILFSFTANASVQAAVIRKQQALETFSDLAAKAALSLNTMSSFIFDKPLDRSIFVITPNTFGTRFFSLRLQNNSGMYDDESSEFNIATNTTIPRNTSTIYMIWRNTDNSLNPIELKFWYWLEYDNHAHLKAFTVGVVLIAVAVILISVVILNSKITSLVIYHLIRAIRPSGRKQFFKDFKKQLKTTSKSEFEEQNVLWTKGADITFQNLTFKSFSGKTILHPIHGILQAGRFTAIMGPSGSGKSTFVNSLCKRANNGKQSGKILIDNREITEETSKNIGFVTQEDIMAPHMTVREALEFSISYRKNRNSDKKKRISAVIERLGLSKVQNSFTKVCSGGEKRRTSIGIELCADTPVLILDEPTSGLDSESALSLCQTLRELSETCNLNIICVIHQPSFEILKQFHDIMLFNEGQLLFHAPVSTVVNVLRDKIPADEIRNNPADEILRTLIAPQGELLVEEIIIRKTQENAQCHFTSGSPNHFYTTESAEDMFQQHSNSTRAVHDDDSNPNNNNNNNQNIHNHNRNNNHHSDVAVIPIHKSINKSKRHNISEQAYRTAPFYIQFIICFVRSFKQFYRDWTTILIENGICLAIGVLIGQIFKGLSFAGAVPESLYMQCPISLRGNAMVPQSDLISPYSTFFNIAISLVSIMRGLLVFGNDMNNFKRECYSGLNCWMYYLAKDLVSMMVMLVLSLSFTAGLQVASPHTHFGILWMVIYGTMLASFPIGYIISYFFTPHTAQLAASLVVMIFFAMSGNQPSIPEMESYVFPFTYIHVISYLKYAKGLIFMLELETRRGTQTLDEVLKIYGFEIEALIYYVYALVFWVIVWRFISIYCLWAWKPRSLFSKIVYCVKLMMGIIYGPISNACSKVKITLKRMSNKRNDEKNWQ